MSAFRPSSLVLITTPEGVSVPILALDVLSRLVGEDLPPGGGVGIFILSAAPEINKRKYMVISSLVIQATKTIMMI